MYSYVPLRGSNKYKKKKQQGTLLLGNLTSVDQVQEDEALLEFCDELLSANMATTLMKVAKAPPSSFLICPYAIKA